MGIFKWLKERKAEKENICEPVDPGKSSWVVLLPFIAESPDRNQVRGI